MELKTQRLRLREFEPADIPILYAYNQHPEFQRYESGPPVSEYKFHRIIDDIIAQQTCEPRFCYYFAMVCADQVIGSCYLAVRDLDHQQAEIGYTVGFEHWRKGFATEAARAIVQFGFEVLDMHRIYAEVISANQASVRVLEKIGMRREAELCENAHFSGRWWNTYLYAMLAHEYERTS
jgi:RimJ/RimL family protein N-acetyltransferase